MDAGVQSVAAVSTLEDGEPSRARQGLLRLAASLDGALVPAVGFLMSLALFGVFIALTGNPVLAVFAEMYRGAFGTWFSVQNSLLRAAPLMLTGLCTALPARLGLIVIGGEGALVIGGLAAAAAAIPLQGAPPGVVLGGMLLASMLAGGAWVGSSTQTAR